MFRPDQSISSLTALMKEHCRGRLVYVGLQGSYLRGEATEDSDIDIMVVIRDITTADLKTYRDAIALGRGEPFDFDENFDLLFSWCRQTLTGTSLSGQTKILQEDLT